MCTATAAFHASFATSADLKIRSPVSVVRGEARSPAFSIVSCSSADERFPGTGNLDARAILYSDVSAASVEVMLLGTVLAGKKLVRLYSASADGFDHRVFFELTNLGLGGIPCLLVGRTTNGCLFGGYNPVGFEARDDYRDTVNARLFVVKPDGGIIKSEPLAEGKSAIFDFYDEAVKFGASALFIPMNPRKSFLKQNEATSILGCHYSVFKSGQSSLFGDKSRVELDNIEVWTDSRFTEEFSQKRAADEGRRGKSIFGRFFS